MSWFSKPKKKPTTFKVAIEKTAEAIGRMEANAVTPEELKNVAEAWQALTAELNPANAFPDDKDKGKDK